MNLLNWKPHKGAVAYSATSMATAFMHSVFRFYYVKIFLDRYRISSNWFQAVQLIYMIWNAINDPLFGYCQDNCKSSYVRSRRHAMLYGAPFFALSFLSFWFPWGDYGENDWLCGVHFLFALCFYDSMFTYVLLSHGCILAEMTNNHEDRLRMMQYSSVAYLIGSLSVFVCEATSNHLENYRNFQATTIVLAMLAWAALTYTGNNAFTMYDLKQQSISNDKSESDNEITYERSTNYGIFRLTWQILSNYNFTWFVIMNFMSEMHGSFAVNFCIIITDTVVPKDTMPNFCWTVFYGSVMLLPTIIATIYRPILSRFGYYNIHSYIFLMKICSGLSMFIIGREFFLLFIAFVLLDSALTSIGSSMQSLVMSDIIDNDMKLYNRSHPMSSMVFGTNALVVKSPQSIAPIITVAILNSYGYEQLKNNSLEDIESLKTCMFTLACLVPICFGAIQYAVWSKYKIRNSHLTVVKYVET